jgi:3-(3-hydroxy-phenyl)propionate hydroxylase
VRRYLDGLGIKPKNAFARGLFVPGGRRDRRGSWLPQWRARTPAGAVERSDDQLGSSLALVGLGVDPESALSSTSRDRWVHAGGRIVSLSPDIEASTRSARTWPPGWCFVVRPDRTVLHDGPLVDVDRLVRESLALLAATAP